MSPQFEWNEAKAHLNLQKHGITFEEARTVFDDPLFITFLDENHSDDEDCYITIGQSQNRTLLLIAHAERLGRIRIISARKATRYEQRFYEEAE
jgi:uncharacterized DUF497 family protein